MARKVNLGTRGTAQFGAILIGTTNPLLVFQGAGAPVDGTTGANEANPGSEYINRTTGDSYINIGTKASPVWQLAAGVSLINYTTTTLTNAQVLALRATPITLVAAPGAGKRLQLLGGTMNTSAAAGAWTESTANLAIKFASGAGIQVSQTVEMTGFIDQAAKMHTDILPKLDPIATEAQAVNQPFVVHNLGAGEFGAGNAASTLKITLAYRILATL